MEHDLDSWCNVLCVTGDQAKRFFLQSGLPMQTLGRIWLVTTVSVYNLSFFIYTVFQKKGSHQTFGNNFHKS